MKHNTEKHNTETPVEQLRRKLQERLADCEQGIHIVEARRDHIRNDGIVVGLRIALELFDEVFPHTKKEGGDDE